MKQIGLLSDTHSYFDEKLIQLFSNCDEIWHAGDIGDIKVLDALKEIKSTRAVFGNIDNSMIRSELKESERFLCEGVDVLLTHIGGYPNKYSPNIKNVLHNNPPQLFICGHSHILKVIFDKQLNFLHINPGAAGRSGFHAVRTAIRFVIDNGSIKDLEIIELQNKSFTKVQS